MSVLSSIDAMLASAADNGLLHRSLFDLITSTTTAATTSSGYVTAQRFPNPFTVPTVGGSVTGIVFPYVRMLTSSSTVASYLCGLETLLGSVTANGGSGTFSDGSAMPTKTIEGTSTTTATQRVFAVVTTVMVGGGTYTLTITYKNQAGTGSKTATLTIPNVAAVNSAFDVTPHLEGGDTGIQDITNITLTGTTGTIKLYGLLVLNAAIHSGVNTAAVSPDPITVPSQMWVAAAGEIIAFYRLGATGSSQMFAMLTGLGDS